MTTSEQEAFARRAEANRIVNLLDGVEHIFTPRVRTFLLAMRKGGSVTPNQLDFLRSLREQYLSG